MPEAEIRAAADGDIAQLDAGAQLVWRFAAQIARDVRADQTLSGPELELLGRRQATELVIACAC